jgi:hypothetical protein
VDEVIRTWVKEASETGLENGDAASQGPIKNEQKARAQAQSQTRPAGINNQQKTKPSGAANGKANGVATVGKSNAQKAKEVINLD